MQKLTAISCLLFIGLNAFSQNKSSGYSTILFTKKMLQSINKKTESIEQKLSHKTTKYLDRIKKREKKLYRKLYNKDSLLANQLFGNIDSVYNRIKKLPQQGAFSSVYNGHLDSLSTALNFFGNENDSLVSMNLQSCKKLQEQLDLSEQIKKKLQARQKLLIDQFNKFGMIKHLKGIQKDVYYYSAQVKEYKALLEDPSRMEQKLMELALKIPSFKEFFKNNSRLAKLMGTPRSGGISSASLSGLQTRASVNQLLINRFGNNQAVTQMMQKSMQSAQAELSQLKKKVQDIQSGSVGTGNMDLPKGFNPNTQKTKSFFKRLEYGFNIQSQKAKNYFPITSDIGLSVGFKPNDNSIIGIGASYKIGLGRGWDHISITHQGIGLRSYVDIKLKGNIWLTGGYEKNHMNAFKSVQQLKELNAWQESGLIGLSKRYKVSKKFKGEMKLMWDFLSYQQVPRTQPLLFRFGYSIK